jgi:hypothetical protein
MPNPKFILLLFLTLPLACLAQDDAASQKIISKFRGYSTSHPGEKVYLHFDRPYYAAGDTLYYKAYLTLPGSNKLSALSGVLHVELIDNLQGKALFSEKLEVTNGVAWGDFALPDTLTNGSYKIRAYTNLMRNNGEADFFEKNIPVVTVKPKNTIATKITVAATAATTLIKPDLQFFPEGGTLINGIGTRIGFKAVNTNGLGIAVKGVVKDNDGKEICRFASTHLGMGNFYFIPKLGKSYKAYVTYSNGSTDEKSLPMADNDGIALSASNDSALVVSLNINASNGYYKINKGRLFTLAVYSGNELTTIPAQLDSASIQAYLYKKKLHTGITRITLFSPDNEPLCERLLFIDNNDQLKLNINTDQPTYGKRQKVTISLSAKDIKDLPIQGDFSVSITDESKAPVDNDAESTIVNYLLLSSELKGNIEQPNYYLTHQTPETQSALDNLMLTQGYRRFEWKAVMNNTDTIPQYQPEKALSIKGTVKTLSGKPMPNAKVSLAAIRQLIARDTTSDANGNFRFDNLYITDTTKVLLRAGKGAKGWNTEIAKEERPFIEKLALKDTTTIKAATGVKPEIVAAIQKQYKQYGNMRTGIILKQVNIHEDKNPEHLVPLLHSDNLNGAGRANEVVAGADMEGCPQLADCLASKVHGVTVGYGGFPPHTTIVNNRTGKAMAILLNGIIFTDQTILLDISTPEIYSVELLETPQYLSIYGPKASGGLIVITLRNGTEKGFVNMQPGLTTYLFDGFYKARQFYAPTYEPTMPPRHLPDIRTTIAWKPVVLTDKDGNASFDFYTADNPVKYRIVAEGISADGSIGRAVYKCTVQ